MERDELAAWLRLCLTPGVGNLNARKLLTTFGLPQAVFEQPAVALRQIVSPAMASALQSVPPELEAQLQATLDWLQEAESSGENKRFLLTLGDPRYPAALLNIEDPPLVLYLHGNIDLISQTAPKSARNGIAIVGSRNATPQGLANAHAFARAFSEAGLVVVSGLALGIDGAAHEGALEGHLAGGTRQACGSTIAVIGTGLDRVYPKKHLSLAHRIVQHGLMLSEFPLGTPPLPVNFPKRNRIISALSLGTLVVEAAVKSGSLITARMASEQGKEVFAIPGSIHSTQSRGCHALIKQGAKLVESAQDVLEELRPQLTPPSLPNSKLLKPTVPQEHITDAAEADFEPDDLVKSLGYDPVSLDALVARTGWDAATLQVRLMELELDGQVARLPGGLYQRVVVG
ncbi:MAG: DNA-processing protein DprA [Burkholderiaceae bacterium]|nr:DNA-processing protein DprA [Burkholderiaceae bacterium]